MLDVHNHHHILVLGVLQSTSWSSVLSYLKINILLSPEWSENQQLSCPAKEFRQFSNWSYIDWVCWRLIELWDCRNNANWHLLCQIHELGNLWHWKPWECMVTVALQVWLSASLSYPWFYLVNSGPPGYLCTSATPDLVVSISLLCSTYICFSHLLDYSNPVFPQHGRLMPLKHCSASGLHSIYQ